MDMGKLMHEAPGDLFLRPPAGLIKGAFRMSKLKYQYQYRKRSCSIIIDNIRRRQLDLWQLFQHDSSKQNSKTKPLRPDKDTTVL